jgi:Flagellar biosynthesis protein, FliO
MREWLEGLAGPEYVMALLWTPAALILLVIVLVIVKLVRSLTFGTFVAGGRNRKTRLAVMDATAVDSHRRLVLVRRDDVEHLLLIGGPTDVVVEQDIRLHAQHRRPIQHAEAAHDQAPLRQTERTRPAEVVPQPVPPRPEPPRPAQVHPAAQPQQRAPDRHGPQLVPPNEPAHMQPAPSQEIRPAPPPRVPPPANIPPPPPYLGSRGTAPAKPQQRDDIDDALLEELEVSLDNGPAKKPVKQELSLEDEMTKLLGELSSHKR